MQAGSEVLRQDRNIRKGRQSWGEVVETMLQQLPVQEDGATIREGYAGCAYKLGITHELEVSDCVPGCAGKRA